MSSVENGIHEGISLSRKAAKALPGFSIEELFRPDFEPISSESQSLLSEAPINPYLPSLEAKSVDSDRT